MSGVRTSAERAQRARKRTADRHAPVFICCWRSFLTACGREVVLLLPACGEEVKPSLPLSLIGLSRSEGAASSNRLVAGR